MLESISYGNSKGVIIGHQIIKQPNGRYCVYSTICDNIIYYDCTREEYIKYRIEEEKKQIETEINEICDKLDRGEKPYYQFTKSFDEMLGHIKLVHGEDEYKKVLDLINKDNRGLNVN